MNSNWFAGLIVVAMVGLLLAIGFGFSKRVENNPTLPPNATEITTLGDGWHEFNLGTNRFLFHRTISGNLGFECITKLN